MQQLRDIEWLEHLSEGLKIAKERRRPIVVKPMGQGIGFADDW